MKPIPFNALAKILELRHSDQTLVLGVEIDSRKVQSGDLFFALPGNKVDGHTFLQEVAAKGASGAVVQEGYQGDHFGLPLLRVPDVLTALQDLARKRLASSSTKVIAITGSLGKTTTKEFATTLLRSQYRIFASPLSYNSQATVPLSILMANGDEQYLILEMGMTHEGNIKNLISIAPPDISLITTLAVQHAINFSDGLAGISREKAAIFSHPKTTLGILHFDMPHYEEVSAFGKCLKKSFSLGSQAADYFLERLPSGVRIHVKGEAACDVELSLPVKVHYQNFLAAVALARNLDVSWSAIQAAAPLLKLPTMRFEKVEKQGIIFFNDAYNANPDSMKAALESLPKPQSAGKVIAVLGDMDALGSYTEEGHLSVAQAALQHADYLLCLGPHGAIMQKVWQQSNKPVELFQKRSDLEEYLKKIAQPGDIILLKGARTHALDQILNCF